MDGCVSVRADCPFLQDVYVTSRCHFGAGPHALTNCLALAEFLQIRPVEKSRAAVTWDQVILIAVKN
jgi:hypothetical protein